MQKYTLLCIAMFFMSTVQAQSVSLTVIIKDNKTKEKLTGATVLVRGTGIGGSTDTSGAVILPSIPDGRQEIQFNYIGYEQAVETITFPLSADTVIEVLISAGSEDLEEVIVASTRTSRTIQNVPTRVETIELEEIEEKSNMRTANVSMILHESTGIQVQQTSATSANASIRLQGLDGRYTQLLKDGYPNFGNFAGGLSILEIPPLDLRQVEIIKGPASTLYGGGAVAGVVNFVSKTPQEKAEYNLVANLSHILQTSIGGFASQRKGKVGYTLLALGNFQQPYDVDRDGFTELPKSMDYDVHPKLFIYPTDRSSLMIGNSFTMGDRIGGDMRVIDMKPDSAHTYFEKNKTLRNTSTIEYEHRIREKNRVIARSSFSYFKRDITLATFIFNGVNYNSFTDVAYIQHFKKQVLITGANFVYDQFDQIDSATVDRKNFKTTTGGIYAQHTWDISTRVILESGLRGDIVHYSNASYGKTEFFILPRISALFKITDKWSSRIGGGLGYKTPTTFTEQTERFDYQNIHAISNVTSERSYGGTVDVNFKTPIGSSFFFSINQMFFATLITNASVLQNDLAGKFFFANAGRPVQSLGFETNAKIVFKDAFKLFAGYTFTDARARYLSGNQHLLLLPQSKLNLTLLYENPKIIKIGIEGYFTDRQFLSDGSRSPSYWEFGIMAEKTFGKVTIFVNGENVSDTRQSRYKRVVNAPDNNPTFDDIWTHTEGFVFNGGIRVKW